MGLEAGAQEYRTEKTRSHGHVEFSWNVFCDNNDCSGPQPEELSNPPASPAAQEEQARLECESRRKHELTRNLSATVSSSEL